MILAGYKILLLGIVKAFSNILAAADRPDKIALAVGFIITLILILTGFGEKILLVECAMLMLWNVIQLLRMSHLTGRAMQSAAVLKKYELKILKIYYSEKNRGIQCDAYSFYAPVMCYDADGQETEAVSRLWSQNMNLEKETEYEICYSMKNPEIFWFPEQKDKLVLPYRTGLCVSAVFFIGLLVFYFST